MGRCIIKPEADEDLYVIWSSVVDNATFVGTKEQVAQWWIGGEVARVTREFDEAIQRTDENGSSDRRFNTGGYANYDDTMLVAEVPDDFGGVMSGTIKRSDIKAFVLSDNPAQFVTPHEDG